MKPDQVSLAIGKGGHNIKLASKLTGYEIDVYRENISDSEDVDLQEFSDEIDEWIINELKAIGCDTAKSVLDLEIEELVQRTDLEEETIKEVMKILLHGDDIPVAVPSIQDAGHGCGIDYERIRIRPCDGVISTRSRFLSFFSGRTT